MSEQVKIFDTTLRDGEQSPGATMNVAEKVRIAEQLEKLRVDVIEAGFPISSEGDFEAVKEIAKKIKRSEVAALARTSLPDIKRGLGSGQICNPPTNPYLHCHLRYSSKV
jgi:2-isopropylmalate synthase